MASEASTDFGNDAKKQDGNSEDGQDVGIPNDNNENAPPPKIKRYNTNEKKLNLGGGTGTGWYSSDRRELDFGDMPEYLDFLKPVAAVVKSLAENFIIEPVKLFFDVTVIPIINISLWAMDDPSRVNYLSGIGQAISAGLGPKEILKAAVLGILESGMKASKAFKEGDATTFAYEFTNIWSAVFDASRSVGGGLKHVNDLRIKRGLHNAKEMINDSTTIDPLNTEISYVNFEKRNKGLKMYGKFVTMREKQVAAMQKKVNKHNVIKDKHYNPDWEYRHDQIPESEGAVWKGCYSAGANKIIIFETAFALPLTSRLPDLYPGSNNYLFSKTGILTFLKGVTEEKTGYHEAYHSVQFKTDPKFYNESSIGIKIQTPNGEIPIYKQYHHRPVEFTQPRLRAPFEGAHNVAAWHGPITDMTYFFFILFPISNMLGNYIEQRY